MINELTSEILFRCPHCQKLFCTDSAINSKNIEFQCTDCNEDFYLTSQMTASGLYQTQRRSIHDFSPCAKCGYLKNKQNDECPSCGVMETKYNDIIKLESPRLFELNKMWNLVIQDIENDQVHQNFLNQAQSMSALSFAAQKYTELKKIMGDDRLIEKYLKQIELRLEAALNGYLSEEKNKTAFPRALPSFRKNFFGIEYTYRNIFLLISFVGVLFFLVNVIRPLFPTMNGLIVAAIILSLGLWSVSKNHTRFF